MVILGCFALSTCLLINDGASRSFFQVLGAVEILRCDLLSVSLSCSDLE